MGRIQVSKPAKLFIGFITNEVALIEKLKPFFTKRFGPIDLESDILDFNFTAYYNEEFGQGLKRRFVSFKRLVNIENIRAIKILANKVEEKFSAQGKRRINIDPGYITPGKLVLLTTKDFYHRVYLGKGIYAEVTLYYKDKGFQPFEWSYPDYKSRGYIEFFNKIREDCLTQLRQKGC